ncbi:MAG: substrate-binding domain-containing protein [Thermodesulfobacteriota bacterium]
MRIRSLLAGLPLFVATMLPAFSHAGDKVLTMSTTTSTQASGLLDILLPEFAKDTGIEVKVIAKGTGAAIRDGVDGNVDIIFVHARDREEQFVADGWGTKRYAVMHNDFVLVGPTADPAAVRGIGAAEALKRIAAAGAPFVSRGDDSGTHTKEQEIWRATGLALREQTGTTGEGDKKKEFIAAAPEGTWYLSIGQGMGKTLTFADEKQAYTLADRGTYVKYRYGNERPVDLEILVEADPLLANPYGIIPVNPAKHPGVKHDLAVQLAEWLVSQRGQALIGGYQLLGRQLFFPDAEPVR